MEFWNLEKLELKKSEYTKYLKTYNELRGYADDSVNLIIVQDYVYQE